MCRSDFFKTLATLLAGTHAVGPLPIDALPTEARCSATPRALPAPLAAAAAPGGCR